MKKIVPVLLVTALCVATASAQFSRVKEKARNLDDKMTERHNAAEGGAPPPGTPPKNGTQPATAAPATQPSAPPIKPGNQQQAAAKLKADIAAVRAKGEATAELKKQFVQDLQLAVMGQNRPSAGTLTQFTESFLPAISAKGVAAASDAKIVQNLVISLNSAGLSATRLQELADEVDGALTKAGAPAGEAAKSAQGLSAIIAEVQSGLGSERVGGIRTTKCPTCRKAGDWFAGNYAPFCSQRCRLIDLGKWLGGAHAISEPLRPEHLEQYAELPSGENLDRPESD